jgi:hypothetical protein
MFCSVEPFLEDRDGIWCIKDLATEFPRTRILMCQGNPNRFMRSAACTPARPVTG